MVLFEMRNFIYRIYICCDVSLTLVNGMQGDILTVLNVKKI